MGKKRRERTTGPKVVYPYPSRYGSHKSMVNEGATEVLDIKSWVVCEDEVGRYVTRTKKLDSGMVDPHRLASKEKRREIKKGLNRDNEEKSN